MRKSNFKFRVCGMIAVILLGPLVGGAMASSSIWACVKRDRQILMTIEERESANAISARKLSDAMFAIVNARMVCVEGRVQDSLLLYDVIGQSVASETPRRGRWGFEPVAGDHPGVP